MPPESVGGARVTALVPMRHHSQRVPGKNFRPFVGKPLYRHVIDALLGARTVERVAIDTDSPVIRDDCHEAYGAKVALLERPAHLCAPDVPMNDILMHDVHRLGEGPYLQTHSTNPLLRSATIDAAVQRFAEGVAQGECDSLFSVTPRRVRIWDRDTRPLNHDPAQLLQTQDLAPFFEENSCLYLFSAAGLQSRRNRIGARPLMFAMDPLEAVDIDEESDFLLAEALYRLRSGIH